VGGLLKFNSSPHVLKTVC